MKLVKIVSRTCLILVALALPPAWLACTNSGLRTLLHVSKGFSPYRVRYGAVEGKLIGSPIVIHDLTLENNGDILQISRLQVDWQMRQFSAFKLSGFEQFLPREDMLVRNKATMISQIKGKVDFTDSGLKLQVRLAGKWQQAKLNAYANISKLSSEWCIDYAVMQVGTNTLTLNNNSSGYSWDLDLVNPELIFKESHGKLQATGKVKNLTTIPEIQTKIVTTNFKIQNYVLTNLRLDATLSPDVKAPLSMNLKLDKLIIDEQEIAAINIKAHGTLEKHELQATAKYTDYAIKLSANGLALNNVWQTNDLLIKANAEVLQGTAKYDLNAKNGNIDLHGKVFDVPTKLQISSPTVQNYKAALAMQANNQNHLQANLELKHDKLSGQLNLYAEDLGLIMRWVPDMTRLKGVLKAQANFSGTLREPIINTEAHLTKITATFPSLGIKIKPMELHLTGDKNGKFILTGKGKMRRGSGDFVVNGFIEPFKDKMPNSITFVGNQLEFVNNADAHLIASNRLNFVYDLANMRLDITGDIDIISGNIYFDYKKPSNVKSKDVVFINEPEMIQRKVVHINPNIHVRIEDGLHFTGYGLDAIVSGKLDICHRHNAMYADGRITLKEGTFQLPGQTLEIQKGRLLYPPGTLLANPMLDIKMLSKNQMKDTANTNQSALELIVQGTAQAPTISASGLSTDKDKALSQALLTGSSVLSGNFIQDKLKISEIGIVTKDEQTVEFFEDPAKGRTDLKNKDLVIGRPLGKNFYIQYLHSMGEINKRLRLKYSLSQHWAIGFESGDQGGGADLSFTYEKD